MLFYICETYSHGIYFAVSKNVTKAKIAYVQVYLYLSCLVMAIVYTCRSSEKKKAVN